MQLAPRRGRWLSCVEPGLQKGVKEYNRPTGVLGVQASNRNNSQNSEPNSITNQWIGQRGGDKKSIEKQRNTLRHCRIRRNIHMPSYLFPTKISNVWCRSERMVEEAERKQRWVDTIMAVMDLVIPGMFRHGQLSRSHIPDIVTSDLQILDSHCGYFLVTMCFLEELLLSNWTAVLLKAQRFLQVQLLAINSWWPAKNIKIILEVMVTGSRHHAMIPPNNRFWTRACQMSKGKEVMPVVREFLNITFLRRLWRRHVAFLFEDVLKGTVSPD